MLVLLLLRQTLHAWLGRVGSAGLGDLDAGLPARLGLPLRLVVVVRDVVARVDRRLIARRSAWQGGGLFRRRARGRASSADLGGRSVGRRCRIRAGIRLWVPALGAKRRFCAAVSV